jgi:hypothetical protein
MASRHAELYSLGWVLGAVLGLVVGCQLSPNLLSPTQDAAQTSSQTSAADVRQGDNNITTLRSEMRNEMSIVQNEIGVTKLYLLYGAVMLIAMKFADLLGDWILYRTIKNGGSHAKPNRPA